MSILSGSPSSEVIYLVDPRVKKKVVKSLFLENENSLCLPVVSESG